MRSRITTAVIGLVFFAAALALLQTVIFDVAVVLLIAISLIEAGLALGLNSTEKLCLIGFLPAALSLVFPVSWGLTGIKTAIALLTIYYSAFILVLWPHRIDFRRLSGFLCFAAVIIIGFRSFLLIKAGFKPVTARYLILLIFGIAWGGDTAAFFVGRRFGTRKLAPSVSPNKTIEGAVGELFGSLTAGLIISLCFSLQTSIPFPLDHWGMMVLYTLMGSSLGILGDLFASIIKRQTGIKDYGTLLPGHGGVLDRFDSVLFIAPFLYIFI